MVLKTTKENLSETSSNGSAAVRMTACEFRKNHKQFNMTNFYCQHESNITPVLVIGPVMVYVKYTKSYGKGLCGAHDFCY